jgi:RND family efflux transporter MFP subunit
MRVFGSADALTKALVVVALVVTLVAGGGANPAYAQTTDTKKPETKKPDAKKPDSKKAEPPTNRRGRGRRGRGSREARVVVATVALRTIGNRVAAVGTGRARRSLTLTSDVSGVVRDILFKPGQIVKQGATLIRLDGEAQEIAARLAQVKVDDAAATVRRYETLQKTAAVSAVQLAQARTAYALARADLEAKEYELKRRTILAPFGGIMGLTALVKGEYLKEGAPIASIDDRTELVVEFVVSENFASFIKLDQDVRALTPALRGRVFNGKISALDSRIDTTSRTLKVEATVPNPENRLIPGMTFSISIRVEGNRLPAVPGLAIRWDRGGAFVWKLVSAAGKTSVTRIGVIIRRRENDTVAVEGNLKEGDRVVVEGGQTLRPGASVTVVPGDGDGSRDR